MNRTRLSGRRESACPPILHLLLRQFCNAPVHSIFNKQDTVMERLLEIYREFGMPLPPDEAPLVQMTWGVVNRRPAPRRSGIILGFLLKAANSDSLDDALIGVLQLSKESEFERVNPTLVKAEDVEIESLKCDVHGAFFPTNTALPTAIQCYARGELNLAQVLKEKARETRIAGGPSHMRSNGPWIPVPVRLFYEYRPEHNDETMLAGAAWTYWINSLVRRESDRSIAAGNMRRILTEYPELKHEGRECFLEALEAALVPSAAEPGSVRADIDALVHCEMENCDWGDLAEMDGPFRKVLFRGFEAVPLLIEHLNDPRLTRSVVLSIGNAPNLIQTVGDVVGDILQVIAGQEFSRDFLGRQFGCCLQREKVERWWRKAKEMGEETYFRRRVRRSASARDCWSEARLAFVESRFPELLRQFRERRGLRENSFD